PWFDCMMFSPDGTDKGHCRREPFASASAGSPSSRQEEDVSDHVRRRCMRRGFDRPVRQGK
ncbi:hypothetical protein NLU14_21905, partial [Marinobacter sp. 71-i]